MCPLLESLRPKPSGSWSLHKRLTTRRLKLNWISEIAAARFKAVLTLQKLRFASVILQVQDLRNSGEDSEDSSVKSGK